MKTKHYLQSLQNSIANFVGTTAASYKAYCDNQKAIYQQQLHQQRQQNTLLFARNYLPIVNEVFYDALEKCAAQIGARLPRHMEQLMASPIISLNRDGVAVYHFSFYLSDDKLTAKQIKGFLNYEIREACYIRNVQDLVCNVQITENNRVVVIVTFKQLLIAAKGGE